MATLTTRFTTRVASGFESKPGYSTSIGRLPSGKEKRNQNSANSLGRWVATPAEKDEATTRELIEYFHACAGRANSFPFKDFSDYQVTSGQGLVVLVSSGIYQLYKRVTVGGVTRDRKIVRPLSAVVAGGGTYSVSTTTGILTHSAGSAPTGWTGEFDNLCRFDSDEISITAIVRSGSGYLYDWGGLGIQEVRL